MNASRNKIHTRIARSDDGGATFSFVTKANQAAEGVSFEAAGDPDCPGGVCVDATRVEEVSSLIEDVGDPSPAARWKLFSHSYMILAPDPADPSNPRLRYEYGTLRMRAAPSPEGPWSEGVDILGWPSAAPLSKEASQLTTGLPGLESCLVLTEPAAQVDSSTGELELAAGCLRLGSPDVTISIELLRSSDHGASWGWSHTLLSAKDGTCVGSSSSRLNGAHLYERGGQRYVVATPEGMVSLPGGATLEAYHGCLIFRRTADGIERDAGGAPVVVGRVDPGEGIFGGACAHHPAGGLVLSALSFSAPPDIFRMFGPIGPSLP